MMKNLAAFMALMLSLLGTAAAKDVSGWVERVRIYPGAIEVNARLDTGASTSSLHCDCIEETVREGEKWIRFSITGYEGESVRLERRVHRVATVKRHFGETQERPVILLGVCVGDTYKETEVSLIDRSGLNYQMLIGRSFMEGDLVVDPGETFINPPRCRIGSIPAE